jgi:hypothetical protein
MEEKLFIVEYYIRSHGSGCEEGPSLKRYQNNSQRFNKTLPSNTIMLSIVTKFQCSDNVLCQQKRKSHQPVTVSTKENYACDLQQVLHLRR